MPDSKWLSVKKDKRHYHYVCEHCKAVSKYRKTPYCPMCGHLMLNSEMKDMYQTTNPDYGYNVSSDGKSTYAGLRHTKEYKQRMSEINKGKVFSEEHKKHLKESHAQYCKKVICLDSNKNIVAEYESLNQAARTVNGHPTNVKRACVSGKKYQTYFWALAEREEVI